MYSIVDESNNEKSTNKGGNAFLEFQNFHDTLFNKKILSHTMRGISSKITILAPIKLVKYLYHVLTINDIFSKMELRHQHMDIKTYKND